MSMYVCSQCQGEFVKFKNLKSHWEECKTPPKPTMREPINPSNNLWLNDGPLEQRYSHVPAGDAQQTTCGQEQNCHYELTITLLEAVEKLTEMVLHSIPVTNIASPQPSIKAPSSSSPKQLDGTWKTVPGARKAAPKPANKTTGSFNLVDILNTIPFDDPVSEEPAIAEVPVNTWANSPHVQPKKQKRRPQVVINNNQNSTNSTYPKTIPGNNSFSGAVKHGKKVALFSDSICNRMGKQQLRAKLNCDINKKTFPGATTDDLHDHYMLPTLKKNAPDLAIIHIGVNDILAKGTPDGGLTSNAIEEVSKNIIKCGEVCRTYGVNNICISSVLPFKGRRAQLTVNQINNNLAKLCKERDFDFLLNDNILYDNGKKNNILFYSDGLHLNDHGRDVLIDNFSNYMH